MVIKKNWLSKVLL